MSSSPFVSCLLSIDSAFAPTCGLGYGTSPPRSEGTSYSRPQVSIFLLLLLTLADTPQDDTYLPSSPVRTSFPPPSAAQAASLRRVPGSVPVSAYALALVELAERASYYGVGGVFANFVQRPLPPGSTTGAPLGEGNPGALGMGIRVATGLSTLFTLMAYTTPLVS